MATSQQDLVNEIVNTMYGYTQQSPAYSTLGGNIGPADLNLPYDQNTNVPRGPIEIGDELIYVNSADATSGVLSVPPWGRGHGGSTADSHFSGDRVTVQPLFPRFQVNNVINQVITALDGDLFGVQSYEFTPTAAVTTYSLPATTLDVIDVRRQTFGPSLAWDTVPRWDVDMTADTSTFSTGISIRFPEWLFPNRKVKVLLATHLVPINPGQMLSDSNLNEGHRDLVVMGSCVKLLMSQDFSRLQQVSVSSASREQAVPITSASTIAGRLNQLYQARIQDEKFLLMQNYPSKITRFS